MAGFVTGILAGAVLAGAAFVAFAFLAPPAHAPAPEAPPAAADPAPEPEAAAPLSDSVPADAAAAAGPETEVADEAPGTDGAQADDPTAGASEAEAGAAPGTSATTDAARPTEAQALAAGRGAAAAPAPETAQDETPAEAETAGEAEADETAAPAWQRHAAEFPAGEQPLYAVILIDTPAEPGAEAALLALPAPVTVALDPADPDAPRRAEGYRSAGHEVAILATRPIRADELAAQRDALPGAVAWLASPEYWPADQGEAARLVEALAEAGLALVVQADEPFEAQTDRQPRMRVAGAVDPRLADRDAVLAHFDAAADAAGEGQSVALVGAVSHAQMRDALMQRAGRRMDAPAAPAPLGAALVARRR